MDGYIRDFHVRVIPTNRAETIEDLNSLFSEGEYEGLNVFQTNIRSVGRNFDELKLLLQQIGVTLDVIVLTETWQINCFSLYSIDGYAQVHNAGTFCQNDGVAVYIRLGVPYKYSIVDLGELRVIEIRLPFTNKEVLITSIYRPPSSDVIAFVEALDDYLRMCGRADVHMLVGDINIDILSQGNHVHDYLDVLGEHGFISAVNRPTRVQGDSKSCVDHVLIKDRTSSHRILSAVYETNITDHFSVLMQIASSQKRSIVNQPPRVKKIFDKDKLLSSLHSESWTDVYECEDVDACASTFLRKLKTYIDQSTCVRQRKACERKKKFMDNGGFGEVNK